MAGDVEESSLSLGLPLGRDVARSCRSPLLTPPLRRITEAAIHAKRGVIGQLEVGNVYFDGLRFRSTNVVSQYFSGFSYSRPHDGDGPKSFLNKPACAAFQ
ncbi:hypothetical protein [Roseivivax lentus]|uniref:hypothetical protein n=1 Tax=Roseivivax lentus TaxID=633194 RepID=UPI00117BD577|nr:hypothetical protein [Roseivivax lentus]